ncbi:MAG: zeta toxin family protein [Acidimicrobiales bacterium]|nr:zeta toxin family protein [Acidimicrobiales bacterium]
MRLDLLVGPNGAGKTTFAEQVLIPAWPGSVFVNADVIAKDRWPGDEAARSYDAAVIAAQTRDELISIGQPLIAETVFSHPSELELIATARARGYHAALHVLMVPVELSVQRVAHRRDAGGHDVPEDRIRARWPRVFDNVAEAIERCDIATCWDNSMWNGPIEIGVWVDGIPTYPPRWPTWAPDALSERWPPTS